MRVLRALLIFQVGAAVGMAAAAAFIKRAVPSQGDEDSDELSLVAVQDGIELESRATAFTGGSILAWYGGVELDLSQAELAPGARLTVHALMGGIAIEIPQSWRVETNVKALVGGVAVPIRTTPTLPSWFLDGLRCSGASRSAPRRTARLVAPSAKST